MKLVDVTARNEKELKRLKRAMEAFVKSAGCNTGEIRWSEKNGEHTMEVENDGKLASDLAYIPKKSDFVRKVEHREHKEDYMWDINMYIRPVSCVTFSF